MTLTPGHTDWESPSEHHRTVTVLFLVALIFASGLFDAVVLKKKDLACVTWFWGLMILVASIASPRTSVSILAAAGAGLSGLILLVTYYRQDGERDRR